MLGCSLSARKLLKILISAPRERVQKLFGRFPGDQILEADPIKLIKRAGFALLQDDSDSRKPIHLLRVNQMA